MCVQGALGRQRPVCSAGGNKAVGSCGPRSDGTAANHRQTNRPITYEHENGTNRLDEFWWNQDLDTCGPDPAYEHHREILRDDAGRQLNGYIGTFPAQADEYDLTYGNHGRISRVDVAGESYTYYYNFLSQRVRKEHRNAASQLVETRRYFYDSFGRLQSERVDSSSSAQWREYVYHGFRPLALIVKDDGQPAKAYAYVTDHLGTPHRLIDENGVPVWAADYEAFGKAWVFVSSVENNLRFPGQYEDSETGLHYNWFRYYSPSTGIYNAADASLKRVEEHSKYLYSYGKPILLFDPYGLWTYEWTLQASAAFWFNGVTGSISIVVDSDLNVGVMTQSGYGGATNFAAASLGVQNTLTNADTLQLLTGESITGGLAIGEGPFLAGEFINAEEYAGAAFGGGWSSSVVPGGAYGYQTNTELLWSENLLDLLGDLADSGCW